jgi:hypothetical protein
MLRRPDWPERLNAYVAAPVRFAWGEADCCLWACGGVAAMTGIDPAAWFRGRYRDQPGAEAALRAFAGVASLGGNPDNAGQAGLILAVRKLARQFGKNEVPPLQAQRGDLVLCEGREMAAARLDALGLCVGPQAVVLTPSGRRFVPLRRAVAAWRI